VLRLEPDLLLLDQVVDALEIQLDGLSYGHAASASLGCSARLNGHSNTASARRNPSRCGPGSARPRRCGADR
jgi:hypothetical protein